MAIGSLVTFSPLVSEPPVAPLGVVAPGSVPTCWRTLLDDASATAQTSANLYHPIGVASSNCHWGRILKPYSKLHSVRCRLPIAATGVTTSPIIRLYLGFGMFAAGASSPPSDGTFRIERFDNSSQSATGITLTFQASPSATNQMNDSVYYHSTAQFQTPTDLRGADYIFACLETAAVFNTTFVAPVEVGLVN